MAFLRSMGTCDKAGCNAPAREELMTWRNDLQGRYCARHAKGALREQEAREKAYFATIGDRQG